MSLLWVRGVRYKSAQGIGVDAFKQRQIQVYPDQG